MRISILACLACLAACGSNNESGDDLSATADLSHAPDPLAMSCDDAIADVYTLPSSLPAFDPSHRGDVFRCAFDRALTAAQINAEITAIGYVGPPVENDVNVYRVAYRTTRAAGAGAGYSSALLLMPQQHRRSDLYVVTGHGTVGLADKCVPSKMNLTDPTITDTVVIYDLGLAGDGYIVMAPDYAGYGYGQVVHGWSLAADEAQSLLDGTRAMKNLIAPSALPGKFAMLGHSQGSHAVLSAQALAPTYGMNGEMVAVAPMAVLWFSDLTWGASLSPLVGLTTAQNSGVIAYGLFYYYGHGELYDGPGGGLAMIQASKRDAVKQLLTTGCNDDVANGVAALGATPSDIYDQNFVASLQQCMIFQQNCDIDPAKTWMQRALADRPTIDAHGAPMLAWHGAVDTTIPPDRAQCGFDKIDADLAAATNPTATFTVCGDAQADHGGVIKRDLDYVNQWFSAKVGGMPDPPGCPGPGPLGHSGDMSTLTCATPPANL